MCQCDDFVYTKRSFVCQPHRATGDKCVELKIVGLNLPPDMYGSFLSVSPFACFFSIFCQEKHCQTERGRQIKVIATFFYIRVQKTKCDSVCPWLESVTHLPELLGFS